MKNLKEHFLGSLTAEERAFIAVFEALPQDKLDWKPDPKSRTAMELASMLGNEPSQLGEVLETGVMEFDPLKTEKFASTAEIVNAFKSGVEKIKSIVEPMSEAQWDAEAKMVMNGQDVWKSTRGDMALGFLFDMVHHRGQLATYIRPMGGKVPSIYGPSADSAS